MGARRVEDLVAYQFAIELNAAIAQLILASPAASGDWKYRKQLQNAASSIDGNIAEGFDRFGLSECVNFLNYTLGSIGEAKARIRDGTLRGYFTDADAGNALTWAVRCRRVTLALQSSQKRIIQRRKEAEEQRKRDKRRSRDADAESSG
jgi:four helix bundle protein